MLAWAILVLSSCYKVCSVAECIGLSLPVFSIPKRDPDNHMFSPGKQEITTFVRLVSQMYAMPALFCFILVIIVLISALSFIGLWHGKRQLGDASPQRRGDNRGLKTSDPKSLLDIEEDESYATRQEGDGGRTLLEIWQEKQSPPPTSYLELPLREQWLHALPPPHEDLHAQPAFRPTIAKLGITSGQLAMMVRQQHGRDHQGEIASPNPRSESTLTSFSPYRPCLNVDEKDNKNVELKFVRYYLEADLHQVWKRKILACVGS